MKEVAQVCYVERLDTTNLFGPLCLRVCVYACARARVCVLHFEEWRRACISHSKDIEEGRDT